MSLTRCHKDPSFASIDDATDAGIGTIFSAWVNCSVCCSGSKESHTKNDVANTFISSPKDWAALAVSICVCESGPIIALRVSIGNSVNLIVVTVVYVGSDRRAPTFLDSEVGKASGISTHGFMATVAYGNHD